MCDREGSLFHSTDWQSLLTNGFGSEAVYAWESQGKCGAAITLFRAGPFRIGYLGFPFGGMLGDTALVNDLLNGFANEASIRKPVCIKVAASAFADPVELSLPSAITPETTILDLQSWGAHSVSTNVKRDIKKASRSGLIITDAQGRDDSLQIYNIYKETISRHKGSLRYTRSYFSHLIELSAKRPEIRVIMARKNDQIAGFVVVARHADTAFYLHGGTYFPLRNDRPSALLLNEAIMAAKADGCRCFNMMSSPANQSTLVEYKEKWGGVTRDLKTYTANIHPSYYLFRIAEKVYSLLR